MMGKGWEKDVCLWMIEVVDGCLFFTTFYYSMKKRHEESGQKRTFRCCF